MPLKFTHRKPTPPNVDQSLALPRRCALSSPRRIVIHKVTFTCSQRQESLLREDSLVPIHLCSPVSHIIISILSRGTLPRVLYSSVEMSFPWHRPSRKQKKTPGRFTRSGNVTSVGYRKGRANRGRSLSYSSRFNATGNSGRA